MDPSRVRTVSEIFKTMSSMEPWNNDLTIRSYCSYCSDPRTRGGKKKISKKSRRKTLKKRPRSRKSLKKRKRSKRSKKLTKQR